MWGRGKVLGFGSILLRLSFLFRKVVVCGHCLLTLSITIKETLKWLSSLPILMQESFRWWQCSDRYIFPLLPSSYPPPFHSPFYLSLISLMVFVDIKHHVYSLYFFSIFCFIFFHILVLGVCWFICVLSTNVEITCVVLCTSWSLGECVLVSNKVSVR